MSISSTERFAVTTNAQKYFTAFPWLGGQVPPLPMPVGAHGQRRWQVVPRIECD